MSAPLIVPKGSDRSWSRDFYYAINKIVRRRWWESKCDEQLDYAFVGVLTHGIGYFRVK